MGWLPKQLFSKSRQFKAAFYLGLFLLLAGLQLRAVETYVLSASATKLLSDQFGASVDTPEGALEKLVVNTASPRKAITPPRWLGWAALSASAVLLAYCYFGPRQKG